ncbi:MAG: hypothetical protein SGPRY_003335 [Prymnesium sp.]
MDRRGGAVWLTCPAGEAGGQVESLQQSLEVAGAAAEDEARTRLEATLFEHSSKQAELSSLLEGREEALRQVEAARDAAEARAAALEMQPLATCDRPTFGIPPPSQAHLAHCQAKISSLEREVKQLSIAAAARGAPPSDVADGAVQALEAALNERSQENDFLRYELQEVQAALKRSDAALNLTFLKNVLVRYMKEGDLDNSLPAIAQALQFSPEEVQEIRESRRGSLMGEVGRTFHLW